MVDVRRNIPYATLPGFRPLCLDLYVPEQPLALCVYLHGGGWARGTRRHGPGHRSGPIEEHFTTMAERGLVVASCDYRLSGEACFPAQVDDVTAACEFVRNEVPEFSGLPLTLWGMSAGAHLVAMAALTSPVAEHIAATTGWATPSDLGLLQDDRAAAGLPVDRSSDSREALLLGGIVDELPELARQASPNQAAASLGGLHEPAGPRRPTARMQLLHGTADENIPMKQTERFAETLHGAGVEVDFVVVDGCDHFFSDIDRSHLLSLVEGSVDFLLGDS